MAVKQKPRGDTKRKGDDAHTASAPSPPVVSIADLKPDGKNCRKHNPRNIGAIVNSLHAVGAARSIVIDENDVILAGNGLVEAAGEAGIENVKVVEADGNTIVAVRRRGLTDKQKAHLSISDNRSCDLSDFDNERLLKTIAEYQIDPSAIEFNADELNALMADVKVDAVREVDPPPETDNQDVCPSCGRRLKRNAD